MLKMGEDWSGQMGLEQSSDLMLGCPSLGLNSGGSLAEKVVAGLDMNSRSMFNLSNGGSAPSGWDPSESFGTSLMASHGNFANPSYPAVPENTEFRGTSQFMHHYSSDANAVEMLPKLSVFGGGGGNFSGMVNPYGLPGCAANKNMMDPRQSGEDCRLLKETSPDAPVTGKRKRNAEGDLLRDASVEISEQNELDEKRNKIEENDSSDQCDKQTGGQTKDSSAGGRASKGDYVHIRARKGQATNSHSLAERVRREKINDRMKLLQELVPGCNKITGKAVMLDEIINYVQSLQQQVEFLSMKLASVNPELNFNIEQILSKEILHLRDSSADAPILGLNPGMSSSSPLCATGIHQGAFSGIPSTAAPYHSMSQGMWDGELQRLLHMGFDSNPPTSNRPNGSSKGQI